MKNDQKISVVVPLFNEEKSVVLLHQELLSALKSFSQQFEIIMVDDGSKDGTFEEIRKLSSVIGIRFSRNYGQTLALAAGIKKATGDVIVTIDGDLENDAQDIPKLIEKLNEEFDIVSGWRKDVGGAVFFASVSSLVANWMISGLPEQASRSWSTLKAYRRGISADLRLSGEMHRMIAAYAGLLNGRGLLKFR